MPRILLSKGEEIYIVSGVFKYSFIFLSESLLLALKTPRYLFIFHYTPL